MKTKIVVNIFLNRNTCDAAIKVPRLVKKLHSKLDMEIMCKYFSYFSMKLNVVGTPQKLLTSTQNTGF